MSQYYFETLKRALDDPKITREKLSEIIRESEFFFGVLKVKVESTDPQLSHEAAREIAELKTLLQSRLQGNTLT